jgi:hypothetical protein
MRKTALAAVGLILLAGLSFTGGALLLAQQEAQEEAVTNYLYISEWELAAGTSWNEAIAEASDMLRGLRETGEFKSAKLYVHHTGPRAALYTLLETDSWEAIDRGWQQYIDANPQMMAEPWTWATHHSDNLVTEIPVE